MASQVMNLLNTSLRECSDLFFIILNRSGMVEVFFAFIFIYLTFRFILSPIFGISAFSNNLRSDLARDSKSKNRKANSKTKKGRIKNE